jgi:methionyl-tRNA formyltransferase
VRILFFGNNWVGWHIVKWLSSRGENIVGLVLHPVERRKYGAEMIGSAKVDTTNIFDGSQLSNADVFAAIRKLQPDIGVSAFFGYILRRDILDLMPAGCVNVHPAFLPYNRGAYPNVWSIVEGTPAGVTIHYMDEGIDTGDMIAQHQVPVEPADTGESLYRKLEQASVEVFQATWPLICAGCAPRVPQDERAGTYHRVRDTEQIDAIDLDQTFTARELIDILRARTFSAYPGAYFWSGQRKVYMRLQLQYEEQQNDIAANRSQSSSHE